VRRVHICGNRLGYLLLEIKSSRRRLFGHGGIQLCDSRSAKPRCSSRSTSGCLANKLYQLIEGFSRWCYRWRCDLLVLLALLIFFCLRRRRRRREEIKSATQSFPKDPYEPQPKGDSLFSALGGELTQPSFMTKTNLNVKGFYRGHTTTTPKQAPLDESQLAREDSANAFLATKYDKPAPTPAAYTPTGPAEVEGRPVYPSANVGPPAPVEMDASPIMAPKTPMSPQLNESPVLGRYASDAYNSHGQSSLAEDVRRRQHSRHIMSWNNYDDRSVVSPPSSMTMSPRIGSPDVSPVITSSGDSTAGKSVPERYRGNFI
jgi:hypothetical protein